MYLCCLIVAAVLLFQVVQVLASGEISFAEDLLADYFVTRDENDTAYVVTNWLMRKKAVDYDHLLDYVKRFELIVKDNKISGIKDYSFKWTPANKGKSKESELQFRSYLWQRASQYAACDPSKMRLADKALIAALIYLQVALYANEIDRVDFFDDRTDVRESTHDVRAEHAIKQLTELEAYKRKKRMGVKVETPVNTLQAINFLVAYEILNKQHKELPEIKDRAKNLVNSDLDQLAVHDLKLEAELRAVLKDIGDKNEQSQFWDRELRKLTTASLTRILDNIFVLNKDAKLVEVTPAAKIEVEAVMKVEQIASAVTIGGKTVAEGTFSKPQTTGDYLLAINGVYDGIKRFNDIPSKGGLNRVSLTKLAVTLQIYLYLMLYQRHSSQYQLEADKEEDKKAVIEPRQKIDIMAHDDIVSHLFIDATINWNTSDGVVPSRSTLRYLQALINAKDEKPPKPYNIKQLILDESQRTVHYSMGLLMDELKQHFNLPKNTNLPQNKQLFQMADNALETFHSLLTKSIIFEDGKVTLSGELDPRAESHSEAAKLILKHLAAFTFRAESAVVYAEIPHPHDKATVAPQPRVHKILLADLALIVSVLSAKAYYQNATTDSNTHTKAKEKLGKLALYYKTVLDSSSNQPNLVLDINIEPSGRTPDEDHFGDTLMFTKIERELEVTSVQLADLPKVYGIKKDRIHILAKSDKKVNEDGDENVYEVPYGVHTTLAYADGFKATYESLAGRMRKSIIDGRFVLTDQQHAEIALVIAYNNYVLQARKNLWDFQCDCSLEAKCDKAHFLHSYNVNVAPYTKAVRDYERVLLKEQSLPAVSHSLIFEPPAPPSRAKNPRGVKAGGGGTGKA